MADSFRVTMVNSSMGCGGAERVMSILANRWAESGADVTIVTVHSQDDDYFELDRRVRRRNLQAYKPSRSVLDGIVNNLGRILKLRRAFNDFISSSH